MPVEFAKDPDIFHNNPIFVPGFYMYNSTQNSTKLNHWEIVFWHAFLRLFQNGYQRIHEMHIFGHSFFLKNGAHFRRKKWRNHILIIISPPQTDRTKLLVSTLCFKVLGIRWYNWNPSISVHFHKNPYWLIWTTLNSYLDDNFNSATFWCLYTLWCQFFWNWQCVKRDHDKTIRQ